MKETNQNIDSGYLQLRDHRLTINQEPSFSINRLKPNSAEYYFEDLGLGVEAHWYGVDIRLSDNATKAVIGGTGLAGVALPDPLLSKVAAATAITADVAYDTQGNGKGVTIHFRGLYNYYTFN